MNNWIEVRKRLYKQVSKHVHLILGEESLGFRKYRAVYERSFNKKWSTLTRNQLVKELNQSQILLLGDFHALMQSQKTQLRILKSLSKQKKRILAVEFLEAAHQKYIDQYLVGKISEIEFLERISWSARWGFPWENYKPILDWAKEHQVPVVGINKYLKTRVASTLNKRDIFSGKVIADLFNRYSDHQIIVIYGDLHLAANHLPKQIKKGVPAKTIVKVLFQNSEKIYFQMLEKGLDLKSETVRLNSDAYCVLSIAPWVKWQNYLLILEKQFDASLEDGDGIDYSDHVERYIRILCQDLRIKQKFSVDPVLSIDDDQVYEKIQNFFSKKESLVFENLIREGQSFFCPEISLAYLGSPSVNSAAALAMNMVFSYLNGFARYPVILPDDFLKLIWIESVKYFGSKMINPKRKTDTLLDLQNALAGPGGLKVGEEALRLALNQKMTELLVLAQGAAVVKNRKLFKAKNKMSYKEAARLLGGMMGEKLYHALRNRLISEREILNLFKENPDEVAFDDFYYETLKFIETLPEPFKSKSEKL